MAKVKIEGTELELDDAICKTDKSLKDALCPYYPAVANADIKRETKGDHTVITVTKRAGSKGNFAAVLSALNEAPESISPILELEVRGWKKAGKVVVDEALLQMLDDERHLAAVSKSLDHAEPQSSNALPTGF